MSSPGAPYAGAPRLARLALTAAGLLILVAPLGGCGAAPAPAATPTLFSLPTKFAAGLPRPELLQRQAAPAPLAYALSLVSSSRS